MPAADGHKGLNGIFEGLAGFSRVAVAVSGGSDSMALLRLAATWRSQKNGPRDVFGLTVDHGLRPESAGEAQQVSQWCRSFSISHQTLFWQGDKPQSGIQAKARNARYDLMSGWCRENRVPVILTGHTADDQAETVLMRQQRTGSDRSLAAIWPENEWRGIKLLRPLLHVGREILRDYLRDLGQPWLDDPSNANEAFERVRIRKAMAGQDLAALRTIAEVAQARVKAADAELSQWLSQYSTVDRYAVVRLPRAILSAESFSRQVDILGWALSVAGDGQKMERGVVEALAKWLATGPVSRRSAGGAILSARRHVVEIMREPGRIRSRFTAVSDAGSLLFDGRFDVTAPQGAQVGAMGVPPLLKRPKDVPALAFSALPVVRLSDGTVHSAVNSARNDVSAALCERFRH